MHASSVRLGRQIKQLAEITVPFFSVSVRAMFQRCLRSQGYEHLEQGGAGHDGWGRWGRTGLPALRILHEANFLEVGMNNTTDESNLLSLKAVMRVMKGLVAITMVIRLMIKVNFFYRKARRRIT